MNYLLDPVPERIGTGNAAAPQKLELAGFDEETQAWAWETFKKIAKSLTTKNHFTEEEWTSMEAEAIIDLLTDDAIVWDPAVTELSVHQYLAGVINRKLKHAAAKIADDRSVWTESRRSLDMPSGDGDETGTLGDILASDANLETNRKFIEKPRAIAVRNKIKRLRDTKNHEGLARFRAELVGRCVPTPPPEDDGRDGVPSPSADDTAANPDTETDILGRTAPVDEFEADSEDLNLQVFDAADHHAKAVAEMGYTRRDDDEPPAPTSFRSRPASFGHLTARPVEDREREKIFDRLIAKLEDPKAREWCRRCREEDADPVQTYKDLGIEKNDYYKKLLPMLRRVFAGK